MFDIHHFTLFLLGSIALNLTPWPDSFYVLGRSVAQGARAGIASALGISARVLIHACAAALGLSAWLTSSATLFLAIKYRYGLFGFLGLRMLSSRNSASVPTAFHHSGFFAVFRQGLLTNVFNPKVALFFLAFLPQFITVESPTRFMAFLTLGICFVMSSTRWSFCLLWFASAPSVSGFEGTQNTSATSTKS